MSNPWKEQHKRVEARFAENAAELAYGERAVEFEFAGTDEYARPCACGGTLYYRATVGALQCPDCRQLARTNGDLIG